MTMPKWLVKVSGEIEVEADSPEQAVDKAVELINKNIDEPFIYLNDLLDFKAEKQ